MKEFILMADIIDSSSFDGKQLMATFSQIVQRINLQHKKSIKSPLTITLGDEFQGVTDSLQSGLAIIIALEEELIAQEGPFQLRYVLNEGKIDTSINTKKAYKMLGSGLTDARHLLEDSKKDGERFIINLQNKEKAEYLNQTLYLYQHLVDGWNQKDFKEVSLFIEGNNYREVAKIIKKDESSTWRRERSLAIKPYNVCKKLIFNISK